MNINIGINVQATAIDKFTEIIVYKILIVWLDPRQMFYHKTTIFLKIMEF